MKPYFEFSKKLTSLMLIIALLFTFVPKVHAANLPANGTSGSCTWSIDADGTLTIRPTNGVQGNLERDANGDYSWKQYQDQIKRVEFNKKITGGYGGSGEEGIEFVVDNRELTIKPISATNQEVGRLKYDGTHPFLWANSNITTATFDEGVIASGSLFGLFDGCSDLTSVRHIDNLDTVGTRTSDGLTSTLCMFRGCTSLQEIDVSHIDTSKVQNMAGMFQNCSSLTDISGLSEFKTNNVTSMRLMFSGCSSLEHLDVNRFNTSKVTDMSGMFQNCSSLYNLNIEFVNYSDDENMEQNMSLMFDGCTNLSYVEFGSDFNTNCVTTMAYMFRNCSNLTRLNLDYFSSRKLKKVNHMFLGCSKLESINLSGFMGDNFNLNEVEDMSYMFHGCSSLTGIQNFNWIEPHNVKNVKAIFRNCSSLSDETLNYYASFFDSSYQIEDMSYMFDGCTNLNSINFFNSFRLENVKTISHIFSNCPNIENFAYTNTSNVENLVDISYMFQNCKEIKTIDLSEFNARNIKNMRATFQDCTKLNNLKLHNENGGGLTTECVTDMTAMFSGCSGLRELDLSNFDTTDNNSRIDENNNLTKVKMLGMFSGILYRSGDKIIIGDRMNFHIDDVEYEAGSFGRGTWRKIDDNSNELLSAVEVCYRSTNGSAAGTYEKVSNISDEFQFDNTVVNYQIDLREMKNLAQNINFNNIVDSDHLNLSISGSEFTYYVDENNKSVTISAHTNQNSYGSCYNPYGEASFVLPGVVKDANGNRYNLKVRIENASLYNYDSIPDSVKQSDIYTGMVRLTFSSGGIGFIGMKFKTLEETSGENYIRSEIANVATAFDVTMEVVDDYGTTITDGNYIFSAYDIDTYSMYNGEVPADGKYTEHFGDYSEGVNLKRGYSDIRLSKSRGASETTFLTQEDKGSYTRITGTRQDNESELSEFTTLADTADFSYTVTFGTSAGFKALTNYQPVTVNFEKLWQTISGSPEYERSNMSGVSFNLYYNNDLLYTWQPSDQLQSYFLMPGVYRLEEVSNVDGFTPSNDIELYVGRDYSVEAFINGNVLEINNNTVQVKNDRNKYPYSIHYYYDGEENENYTVEVETGALFGSTVTSYTDKKPTGYRFDKVKMIDDNGAEVNFDKDLSPLVIKSDANKNRINVYYVKDNYDYTIEYYYDGNIDDSLTESGSALFGSSITEFEPKVKTGYKFDHTVNRPLRITENAENNIMKVYYVKDPNKTKELSYTVNYYKDGVKQAADTQVVTQNVQVLEPNTMTVNKTAINTTNKYTGYSLGHIALGETTITELPNTVTSGDIINVYYTKNNYEYRVEYYYNNEKDETKTEVDSAPYGTEISTYPNKVIDGYKLLRAEGMPLTISEKLSENVIKVYYVPDSEQTKTLTYTVEYYKDNVKSEESVETQEVQLLDEDIITVNKSAINITDKYTGYKLDTTKTTLPIPDTVNTGTVIKIYYTRDTFGYRIEYYYDNEKDTSLTETGSALYGEIIREFTPKAKNGYKFDHTENNPLTVSEVVANNIMKVFYVTDDAQTKTLTYTVEYYKDNVLQANDTQTVTKNVQVLKPNTMNVDKTDINIVDKYTGYELDAVTTGVIPNTVTSGDIIRVYYVRGEFEYHIEYYYDNVKDETKTITATALYGTEIDAFEDKRIDGYRFDHTTNKPLLVTENAGNNIMKVYYVADDGQTKTIEYRVNYYKNGEIATEDTQVVTQTVQLLDSNTMTVNKTKINTTDKYYGYKLDLIKLNGNEITEIPETVNSGDVIDVYYVVDPDNKKELTYTVQYYINNTLVTTSTEIVTKTVQVLEDNTLDVDKNAINITDKYYGYKLDAESTLPIPDEVTNGDIIRVYYVTDYDITKELSYTVEYYKDDVKQEENTKTITVQVLEDNTIPVDKESINIENKYPGYKLDTEKTELPLPDEVTKGTVIKIYYTKDTYEYTIEYYFNGEKDPALTEAKEALFETEIDTYPDKVKTGYELDKVEGLPLIISEKNEMNVIKVKYVAKPATVTVAYIDANTKEPITENETITTKVHENVNLKEKEKTINGYVLINRPADTVTVTKENETYEYTYAKEAKVIVEYKEYETEKTLENTVEITGYEGKDYTATAKEINGYEIVVMPSNSSDKMKAGDNRVVFYYRKKISPTPTPTPIATPTTEPSTAPTVEPTILPTPNSIKTPTQNSTPTIISTTTTDRKVSNVRTGDDKPIMVGIIIVIVALVNGTYVVIKKNKKK